VFDDDLPDAFDLEAQRKPTRPRKGQPFQTLSIAEIRLLPDDTAVITSGVVTMPTGRWDPSRAYIQSGVAGVLVHSFGASPLRLGDNLTIRGRVHHFHGEVEIAAVKGGEQTTGGGIAPSPSGIVPSRVGSSTEGLLVQLSGQVDSVDKDYATLTDDSGSARLFLYARLNLPAASLRGSPITVTSVVNAEDSPPAAPSRAYAQRALGPTHRVLPRALEDVIIGVPAVQTARAGSSSRRPGSGDSREAATTTPRVDEPVGTATPFVTPVMSSADGETAGNSVPEPAVSAGRTTLVLTAQPAPEPPWRWILAALAVAGLGTAAYSLRRSGRPTQRP
jgi:hypothetical protein